MKLKQLTAFPMLVLSGLIISSCATNQKVEKMLIGTWKPMHAENLSADTTQGPKMQTVIVDTSTDESIRKNVKLTLPGTPDKKTVSVERAVANEMRSPVMIGIENNQRIAEKYYPGNTIKATWKLKGNGKRIAVKEPKTGRKATLKILSLTDSTLVVIEKLPVAQLRIKYSKIK